MSYETRFHLLSKSLFLFHYSPASWHSFHPLDLLIFLLSLSIISQFLLIPISLSLLSWFVWSCSRSNSRCSLPRILLFIWTVALATPCSNARWVLFVDSNDSTLQGLMFSAYNENKVEAREFVSKTSGEGEPATDESVAMLFDPAIWRNETKIIFKNVYCGGNIFSDKKSQSTSRGQSQQRKQQRLSLVYCAVL